MKGEKVSGEGKLKQRIIKLNSFSIFAIIILFSVVSFAMVYYILKTSLQRDIAFTKQEYLSTKKAIVKNQVYNFINFIDQIKKRENEKSINELKKSMEFLTQVLKNESPARYGYILSRFSLLNPQLVIALSDLKGNKIYANFSEYNTKKRKQLIKKLLNKGLKNSGYFTLNTSKGLLYITAKIFTNKKDGKKYFLTTAVFKSSIDKKIQKQVVNLVHTVKFVFNKGYISILKILNYEGGKKYAKFVAIPIKPEWEGLYLNDSKKDAKGIEYRKVYLKILREKGEGYFTYWFRGKDGNLYKKISFIKLYKPFNWAIIAGVYIDEMNNLINKKKEQITNELKHIFFTYIVMSFIFLIIVYFITRYENRLLSEVIEKYEEEITKKNEELEKLNKTLQQEVEKKTQELMNTFFTDPLTGLPNREKLLVDLKNRNYVAILNIDSFKEINDFYGIEIGDRVLIKVASLLKEVSEVYKLSGDEYGMLGDDVSELKKRVEEAIYQVEKQKFVFDGIEIEVSMRAGIGETLTKADMALKYIKQTKKEKVIVYDETLPVAKEYENNLKWKNIIKQALKDDRIIAYAQPIVNAKTFKTEKFECLMRIEYEGKIYSPAQFLNISRKTGQYIELQKRMIEKCFKKFAQLEYKFSINLSAYELTFDDFKNFLVNKIDEYNVHDKLIIELLEDEKLHDEELIGHLIFLNQHGVEFAIDDFGSGHSNLSYLVTKLPVNILKIDGSLIKNVDKNKSNYKLVQALVTLGKIFKLTLVAEFVENEKIAFMLRDLGIDYLQGYYFSKPLPLEEIKG